MKHWRMVLVAVLLFCVSIAAQKPADEDAAKVKLGQQTRMIEAALADIEQIKLGENRAYIFAQAGSLFWDSDLKRSRVLFGNAVAALINAQAEVEQEKRNSPYEQDLLLSQSTRPNILRLIAARDAIFALDALYRSRPTAVERALNAKSTDSRKIGAGSSGTAQNEYGLEQNLIRMAADQDPERAIKLIKEALKKDPTYETLNLLRKLNEREPDTAAELLSQVIAKLGSNGFSLGTQPDHQAINISINLLTEFIRVKNPGEKALKFDDSEARSLFEKLLAFHLRTVPGQYYYSYRSLVPIAEKLSPSSVEQLKKLQTSYGGGIRFAEPANTEAQKLMNAQTDVGVMLAEADRFPDNVRGQIYQTAARRLAESGDIGTARNLLEDKFDDYQLDGALNNLNWNYMQQLIKKGRFAEAETVIDGFPDENKYSALIGLARSIFRKDPKTNSSYASSILNKIRAEIGPEITNSSEMSAVLQTTTAYAEIDPSEAFRTLEPLIGRLNELSEASAVVYGFQRSSRVKNGEYVITSGNLNGQYIDPSLFRELAKKDFDRTAALVNLFSRREMRVLVRLQIAEALK